jgi:hypothetical protein
MRYQLPVFEYARIRLVLRRVITRMVSPRPRNRRCGLSDLGRALARERALSCPW